MDELDSNAENIAIVRAIIALGDALGLSVMAEGVERLTQAGQLQTLNCHLAQGHFFGMPLSAQSLGSFPPTISEVGNLITSPVKPVDRRDTTHCPELPDRDWASIEVRPAVDALPLSRLGDIGLP
jgi:predicted signal transduction protein with EAL and GGDEF domain